MQAELTLKKNPMAGLIEKLAAFEPADAPFISLYLNAQADERGRDNYGAFLKTELANAAADFGGDTEQSESFKADVEKIEKYLSEEAHPEANGIAIFACSGADFFQTAQFETKIENNRFFVFDRPYIYPLARLIGQNPRFTVVQADTNHANIYVFGNETNRIENDAPVETKVEEIHNVKTQRQQAGGWSQQRFQRRIENFHKEHAKEIADTLDKLVRDEHIEIIVLSGQEAKIVQLLNDQLTKAVQDKIVGTMNLDQYASEEELREAALEIVERFDREQDREAVARMINATESSELGCYGVSKTLAALSNGQVEELLILADPRRIRYSEENVEKVLEAYAPGDDNSLTDALPDTGETRQILDELIKRAFNSAARIRFIEENSLLSGAGGVGAIFRYKIESTAS
jgi:peptide subunit release factor 1 (eRF1)